MGRSCQEGLRPSGNSADPAGPRSGATSGSPRATRVMCRRGGTEANGFSPSSRTLRPEVVANGMPTCGRDKRGAEVLRAIDTDGRGCARVHPRASGGGQGAGGRHRPACVSRPPAAMFGSATTTTAVIRVRGRPIHADAFSTTPWPRFSPARSWGSLATRTGYLRRCNIGSPLGLLDAVGLHQESGNPPALQRGARGCKAGGCLPLASCPGCCLCVPALLEPWARHDPFRPPSMPGSGSSFAPSSSIGKLAWRAGVWR